MFYYPYLGKKKLRAIDKVSLALWEPDGTLSIFLDSQYQTVTPVRFTANNKTLSFPHTVIKEGKIIFKELAQMGKDANWLKHQIKNTYNLDIHDILLATLDDNDHIKICVYN